MRFILQFISPDCLKEAEKYYRKTADFVVFDVLLLLESLHLRSK